MIVSFILENLSNIHRKRGFVTKEANLSSVMCEDNELCAVHVFVISFRLQTISSAV